MSTATGLTVRYGEGRHIIFVNDVEGFAKERNESSFIRGECSQEFKPLHICTSFMHRWDS